MQPRVRPSYACDWKADFNETRWVAVGRALAAQGYPLVYGGGMHGLMGVVANAVLEAGGEATGIVPYAIYAAGGERDKSTMAHANPGQAEKVKVWRTACCVAHLRLTFLFVDSNRKKH